jgi:tape measure domain-containing protein
MATIDDKVVAMSFESSKFESGVANSLSAIDKLKAALHFPNAGKGLDDITKASSRVDLSHIGRGVDDIKNRLSALSVAALAIFANIAQKAFSVGTNVAKAFTLDPLKAGFSEYTTNLNAVQTILANTQASGAKLKDVNAALKQLNDYSDKTIYNFSQMAKNIGTFTAAGVDLDTATGAIKGIANLAALSGSNAEQASTAMYQLSQAISAGRVSLQDWNSVVNAGMGGTVFQRALAQTAVAMGKLDEGAVKLKGSMKNVTIEGHSFRESVSAGPGKESWLTSDVLTNTLQQFTGDLSKAELKAQGFNEAQIKAIQQTAKTALHAATEVKTLSGLLDTAKETAGSGWAQTWQIIFGDFGEAKALFTGLSNAINGFIGASADARNKVLGDWKALGGRTVLINSIKTAFHNLALVIAPIKEAFRDIFPATTGKDLFNLTLRFQEFANALKPSETTIENLKRTFRGLFAMLDIGKQIISGIFGVFGRLFGVMFDGSGSFLEITASIGDFLVKVDEALKKGDGLDNFFTGLGDILSVPIELLHKLADALANLFGGFSSGGFSDQMGDMTGALGPFQTVVEAIGEAWTKFIDSVQKSGLLQAALDGLVTFVQNIGPAIGQAAGSMNFEAILAVIRTGLFGGLVLMLKQFFGKGSFLEQVSKGFGDGIIANLAGTFKALEGSMVAIQQNIKAKTLKEIAIAIALLTASVVALSFVDPAKLNKALVAIGVMAGELLGAMAIMDKVAASTGFLKLPFIAGTLILFAGAIDLLTIAVFALSRLDWNELAKGLTGVAGLLAGVSAASIPLSANSAGMVRAGIGIIGIAVAMKILASAMGTFGNMAWGEIAKGLVAVAGGLVIFAAAAQAMPKSMALQGAGVVVMAAGLKVLASAMQDFGGMDWGTIGKGLAAIGGALLIIAGAVNLMPKSMVLQAAGLVILAFALGKIADAVEQMGGMSIKEIAKGLGTMAGALIILAGALYLMTGAIGGAAALTVAAAGIALLAPALERMGKMSWGEILRSLVMLGAALAVIGAAGILLAPTIPLLLGLGAALLLIGGGLALAGAGIALIGVGLSAIAVAGPTAIGILVAAMKTFVQGIIENAKLIVLGLLEIAQAFADTAPQFVDAMVEILGTLLDAIIQLMPQVADAFTAIIDAGVTILRNNQGKIIQAGFDLLKALLQGLKNNIPALVTTTVDIIVRFLNTVNANLGRIITAGTELLKSFVKGIVSIIPTVVTTTLQVINRFIGSVADNLGRIATAGMQLLARFLAAIAARLGTVIKAAGDVVVAFIEGVGNQGGKIVKAATDAMIKFVKAVGKGAADMAEEGAKAIVKFLDSVATTLETHIPEMRSSGMRIGMAIADGMTFGLASKAAAVAQKAFSLGSSAIGAIRSATHTDSPSKDAITIGEAISEGLAMGMDDSTKAVAAGTALGQGVIDAVKGILEIDSPSKVMIELGRAVSQGFAKGIRGESDDIRNAFAELNEKLTDAMVTARETIASEEDKLKKLREAKKPDQDAIRAAQKTIEENELLLKRSTDARKVLIKDLADEKAKLIGLANDYEKITEKLKAAQQALIEAKRVRDDAIQSYTDKFSQLPAISDLMIEQIADANTRIADAQANLNKVMTESADDIEKIAAARKSLAEAEAAKADMLEDKILDSTGTQVDLVATYMEQLRQQTEAVAKYRKTLDELRKMGLDDETFKQLLEQGTAGQQFADQLLAGGDTAVKGVAELSGNLEKESKKLGTLAGKELYQAGVDAAAGLVKGLASQSDEIRKMGEQLAKELIAAIKKELKVKSPSEVFAEIGEFAMMGFARGITRSMHVVTDAVENAATDALSAMKKSVRNLSDMVSEELNPNPVITPILDLTLVRAQAGELGALTNVVPITAAASYGQASAISAQQTAAVADPNSVVSSAGSVIFEQNNYSPEALSEIEIYRQTKNQISQLKSVLDVK